VLTVILSPFIVIAGGVLAILMYTDWKSKNHTVEHRYILGMTRYRMTTVLTVLSALLAFAGYSLLYVSCSGPWLRARPTKDWQNRIKGIDTAIVLGFGMPGRTRKSPRRQRQPLPARLDSEAHGGEDPPGAGGDPAG